ncbi:hypothetical protein AB6D60_22380 [Vibrio splendidus]
MNTPIYVYDSREITERAKEIISVHKGHRVYYSLKSNSNKEVLRILSNIKGIEAEVCSTGELDLSIEVGFDSGKIIFGGPGKTKLDIEYAINKGVTSFSIESINELKMLNSVEKFFDVKLNKILRIYVNNNDSAKLNMMKPDSKFGISIEELKDNEELINDIFGLHFYFGTQFQQEQAHKVNVNKINELVLEIEDVLKRKISYVNYGGGLEWPYMKEGSKKIENTPINTLDRVVTAFEYGRYLVASSGTLYTTVVDVKFRDKKQIVVLDAGIHTIAGVSASGRLFKPKVTFNIMNHNNRHAECIETAIYGPLCTPLDYFTLSIKLPIVEVGDIISIPNVGAYGFATGIQQFLKRNICSEVINYE